MVILGDFNVPNINVSSFFLIPSTLQNLNALKGLKALGFHDAFEHLPSLSRTTSTNSPIGHYLSYARTGFQLDYILIKNTPSNTENSIIVNEQPADILSDHRPIMAPIWLETTHRPDAPSEEL